MRASERLQDEKDIALASSKIAIEKAGNKLPAQAELNIANQVDQLSSITGGIGSLFSSISGSFSSLLGSALSSISSLAGFNPSSLLDSANTSDLFESSANSISSVVDSVKQEEIDNRVDRQATITDPYTDENGIITYKDFAKMLEDILARKYVSGTVLKNESTKAFYVAVQANTGVFFRITLFNYNLNKKRSGELPLIPNNATEINTITGVKVFEGSAKKD